MVKLLDAVLAHVGSTPAIRVAALFGSQARRLRGAADQADEWSDIDLQIVVDRPDDFADFSWCRSIPGHLPTVCAQRPVFGGVYKQTILFEAGELDLVVLPYVGLNIGRCIYRLGWHRWIPPVRRGLNNFADIMRFEHVVVKGGPAWERFYCDAGSNLPRMGMSDAEVIAAADVAYVDAVAVLGRIERGELVNAQRILHQSVVETNIRLLHEWRERRGLPAYHRGRRAEKILPSEELRLVQASSHLDKEALARVSREMIAGTRYLRVVLTGREPSWPPL